jgi:hypothetical protein
MEDELARRRWEKDMNPANAKPIEALEAALRDMRSGKLKADHIVIAHAKAAEDNPMVHPVGFYQSGSLPALAVLGMLDQVKDIILKPA